jgi:hypothetical protein
MKKIILQGLLGLAAVIAGLWVAAAILYVVFFVIPY